MIKFLKKFYKDFVAGQNEISEMGIYSFPTTSGIWCYIDEQTLKEYYEKKKVESDEST
jgi:hypothetical protein